MSRSRAYRRAQKNRARAHAKHIVEQVWRFTKDSFRKESGQQRLIRQLTVTPKPCSCEGCGNQRRYQGKTLQELRFLLDSEEILSYHWSNEE